MNNDYFFLYLLLASNALLLAIAAIAVIRFEWRWQRIESFWDSPTGSALIDATDDEIREQSKATRRLEQRLSELQRTLTFRVSKAPDELLPIERNLPIENAVRMARSGASVVDLTRNCGLNVGEARLMKRLHGRASASVN